MQITEVRINRMKKNCGKLAAFASVTFDDVLVVRGFRVIQGEEGEAVVFPSQKGRNDDKYYDTVFALNRDFRESVSQKVLSEYNAAIN